MFLNDGNSIRWSAEPEEQGEHREWADVEAGPRDGAEDPASDAGRGEDEGLPDSELLDAVIRRSLVLSEKEVVLQKYYHRQLADVSLDLQDRVGIFW